MSHLKILSARGLRRSRFYTEDSLNLDTNLQNSAALVTPRVEFRIMQYDALQLALA
jgi:hypothetical protein